MAEAVIFECDTKSASNKRKNRWIGLHQDTIMLCFKRHHGETIERHHQENKETTQAKYLQLIYGKGFVSRMYKELLINNKKTKKWVIKRQLKNGKNTHFTKEDTCGK